VPLTSVVRLAAAVLTAVLLASCTNEDPNATSSPDQELLSEDSAGDGPVASESAGDLDTDAASADNDSEIDPSFLSRRAPRILPHDYEIGELQDLLATGAGEREAIGTLLAFLGALAEGTIAEATLVPDRRQTLSRSLRFHLSEQTLPRAVRIGALTVAEEQIHLSVRLFGEPGRAAGEVYLEATVDGWRVADLQLDLQRLSQPYTAQAEFAPSAARWVLPYP
jgi:hypothetical protein